MSLLEDLEKAINKLPKNNLSGLTRVEGGLFEWTSLRWIATQVLELDGVQESDEKTQAAGGAATQVFGAIFEPPKGGSLVSVSLGLTCQLKSDNAGENKSWQWKARNKNENTWVDLQAIVTGALTTSHALKSVSGIRFATPNFDKVPFEIGLFCTPSATYNIVSQVVSSSTYSVLYKPD